MTKKVGTRSNTDIFNPLRHPQPAQKRFMPSTIMNGLGSDIILNPCQGVKIAPLFSNEQCAPRKFGEHLQYNRPSLWTVFFIPARAP